MKKVQYIILLIVYAYCLNGQTLLLEENFNFSGNLTDNGWTAHDAGETNPITTTTGLSYTGYVSSGIGNAALLDDTGEDVNRSFASINTGSIYISFLVNLTTSHTTITEGYILHLRTGNAHFSRFYVDYESSSGNVAFGISQTGNIAALKTSFSYSRGSTYLVVIKYTFIEGELNDAVQLWIFSSGVPDSESNAGVPTLGPTTTSGEGGTQADPSSIDRIALRQYNSNQNVIIDGIRISDSWSLAPLPVELSSFSALIVNEGIKLEWRTETEINNYGFDVERSSSPLGTRWNVIAFIKGFGNSNSPREYSFIDRNINYGEYAYRLRQIDNNGTFEYSKILEVAVDVPLKYELSQNYPNPFNPATDIAFTIPQAGMVTVKVYNTLGEEIAVLINGFIEQGIHTVNFNASDLNSGIYFYKLESGDFVQVKKMILLK